MSTICVQDYRNESHKRVSSFPGRVHVTVQSATQSGIINLFASRELGQRELTSVSTNYSSTQHYSSNTLE